MKAVWIALLAVGVSLFSVFIALYAAQVKKARHGKDAYSNSSGDSVTASDCAPDGGDGGCD